MSANGTRPASTPTLASLIQQSLDKGLTYKQLEERSGGVVKAQTFNTIVNGKHSLRFRDEEATARGIAQALGEPVDVVRGAIHGDANAPQPIAWPRRFDRLGPDRRRLAFQLLDNLLSAQDAEKRSDQEADGNSS